MELASNSSPYRLQPFEPESNVVYTLEAAAHLAQVGRHFILICIKEALITPLSDPEYGGYYFARDEIRRLRRIRYLRTCGVNLPGIRMILELTREVEDLRRELAEREVWR